MNSTVQLKEGDRVAHKTSPGFEMILVRLKEADGLAICEWFDGKTRKEDVFHLIALVPFEEEPIIPGSIFLG